MKKAFILLVLITYHKVGLQIHAQVASSAKKNPGAHWIWGWISTRVEVDVWEMGQTACPCRLSKYGSSSP